MKTNRLMAVILALGACLGGAALASAEENITDLIDTGVPGGNGLIVDGTRFVSLHFDSPFRLVYHDTATGATTPIGAFGIERFPSQIRILGDWVAFIASEEASGRDLNGDGDTGDGVPHLFRISTGTVTSLGVAAGPNNSLSDVEDLALTAEFLAFSVSERSENQTGASGRDLSGDGDALDDVLHYFHLASGTLTDTGVDIEPFPVLQVSGPFVAFAVFEQQTTPVDRNGDGDTADVTTAVLDFRSAAPIWRFPAIAGRPIGMGVSGYVSLRADEVQQGQDLNGDGIVNANSVAFTYDPAADALVSLGLVINASAWAGDVLVFQVSESGQGQSLNPDSDLLDQVLHVYDPRSGDLTNLGLATIGFPDPTPESALFHVRELSQGVDFNGDAVLDDDVLQILSLSDGSIRNTGLANVLSFASGGDAPKHALLQVFESRAGVDLNGDLDLSDTVFQTLSLDDGTTTNLGLAGGGRGPSWNGRFIVSVSELQQNQDLNGDGDLNDSSLAYWDPSSSAPVVLGLRGRTSGMSAKIFAVSVFELDEGRDVNGDGDQDDTLVLFHAFRGTPEEELLAILETVNGLASPPLVRRAISATLRVALFWLRRGAIPLTIDALEVTLALLRSLPATVIDPGAREELIDDVSALIDQLSP